MQLCGFVVTFLSLWLSQAASQTGSQTPATEVPAIQGSLMHCELFL